MIDTSCKIFRFKIHHDKGIEIVVIPAIEEESAIWMIMKMENCPRNVIERLPYTGDEPVHVPDSNLPPNTYEKFK